MRQKRQPERHGRKKTGDSSAMFKLWVDRFGLVRYETEDSYGTKAATNDIKDAFKKDSKVGLDTSHSNVKWTRGADVGKVIGAVIGAVAGVYFVYKGVTAVATAVTEKKLSELYSDVINRSNFPLCWLKEVKLGRRRFKMIHIKPRRR